MSFQWDDPLLLDQQLTDEERMIRDTARAYAQDKLAMRRAMGELGIGCPRWRQVRTLGELGEFAAEVALAAVKPVPDNHTHYVGDVTDFLAQSR